MPQRQRAVDLRIVAYQASPVPSYEAHFLLFLILRWPLRLPFPTLH